MQLHKDDTKYVLLPCKNVKIVERDIIFGEETELEFKSAINCQWHEMNPEKTRVKENIYGEC